MGKKSRKKTPVDAAQRELAELAAEARRMWSRIQDLGRRLNHSLTNAQIRGLEPETLASFVASWLLTSGDTPLEDLPERLEYLAGLRQEDVDLAWKDQLPIRLAEEATTRIVLLKRAADRLFDAACEAHAGKLKKAMASLCRQMEVGGPDMDELAARGRRYLA